MPRDAQATGRYQHSLLKGSEHDVFTCQSCVQRHLVVAPSGGREVLRVAAPLVVSSLSWTIMTFVDRMFLNWVSPTAMAGAFSAGVSWFTLICLPLGVCSYANTFVAQHDGARQPEQIGRVVWQAIWIAIGFTPIVLAAVPLAPSLFALAEHTPEMYAAEVKYFQILCACAPAMLIAQAGASFYSGRGQTWVVMLVDASAAILNLVLDYLWIFGYAGFPEWGLAGAAWATVLATWVKALVYVVLPLQRRHRARYGTLSGLRLDFPLVRRHSVLRRTERPANAARRHRLHYIHSAHWPARRSAIGGDQYRVQY